MKKFFAYFHGFLQGALCYVPDSQIASKKGGMRLPGSRSLGGEGWKPGTGKREFEGPPSKFLPVENIRRSGGALRAVPLLARPRPPLRPPRPSRPPLPGPAEGGARSGGRPGEGRKGGARLRGRRGGRGRIRRATVGRREARPFTGACS